MDSSFILNLTKFLQSLCNGYLDFEKRVEIIGHIYINVDSNSRKVDYILKEKICKIDNCVTFTSNSFLAQPAEKPTTGRPSSARFNYSPVAKVSRSDVTPSPSSNNYLSGGLDDYEGSDVFDSAAENDDRDNDSSSLIDDPTSADFDQKQATDPDVIIVKVECVSNQSGYSLSGSCPNSGSGRGESQMASAYPVILDQSPSSYAGAPAGAPSHQPDMFSGSSLEGTGDPSGSGRGESQMVSDYPVILDQSPSSYAGAPAGAPSHQPDMFSGSSLEGTGDPSGSGRSTSQMASAYPVMVDDQSPSSYAGAPTGAPSHQPDIFSGSFLEDTGDPSGSDRSTSQMASDYRVMLDQSPSSYVGAPAGAPSHQPNMFYGSSLEGTGDLSGHSLEQRSTSSSPLKPPETGCPVSGKEEEITAYYQCALCTGISSKRKSDIIKHIRCKHRENVTA